MNKIQTLDAQIFDFLYNYHLDEKKAGREFYFEMHPQKKQGGDFTWFPYHSPNGVNISFWKGNIYINMREKQAELILVIAFETPKIQSFAEKMGWQLREKEDIGFSYAKYSKEYEYEDIKKFLGSFIQDEKPKIDEYLSSENQLERHQIAKSAFEKNLFEGFFLKSAPQSQYTPTNSHTLPTRLEHLHIENFKGIQSAKIECLPKDTRWIFLTGENGIGKTLLLQAIALSVFQTEELTDGERKEFINANTRLAIVKYINNNDRTTIVYFDMMGFNLIPIPNKSFAFFGASRLETLINGKTQNKTAHILGKTTQLRNIDNYLFQLRINTLRQNQFFLLKETLCKILNLKEIEINRQENCTHYFEKDTDKPITFSQLSAGYKNIINLIGNIVVELSEAQQAEISSIDVLTGIVIIDEIEAHLHPKMQRFLVEKLTELFPKVQFIVSTHSPIPLLGAPKESVILHVDRTKEKGITVERLAIDFQHLLPEALLSSPIFDFDSFLKRNGDSFDKFSTESDYNEVVFDKMLEEKLEKLAAEGGKKLTDILNKNK